MSDLLDLLALEARQTGEESVAADAWRRSIGDPERDREALRAVSPVAQAVRVRAPVLLLASLEDTVVTVDQSRAMAEALRRAGKPVRLVTLPGDDHRLSYASTRIRALEEVEAFLAQSLSGLSPAPAAP